MPGKNRGDVESFLVLGFGGSGHDLFKSYEVKFLGRRLSNGIKAGKLELIPKSDRLRNNIARILALDRSRAWEFRCSSSSFRRRWLSGDYRLAKYSEHSDQSKASGGASLS
jgi:hypothetical protein